MDRKFKQIANGIFAPGQQCLHENQKHANEQIQFKTFKNKYSCKAVKYGKKMDFGFDIFAPGQ